MSEREMEIEPWSEEHDLRIEEENAERDARSERVREINSRGFDHGAHKRWYEGLPIEKRIEIEKRNIEVAIWRECGHGAVQHFQAKLIALMEEQNAKASGR